MSLLEKLGLAAAELEAASRRQDFAGASACAARYAELLQQAMRELPPDEAARHVSEAGRRFEAARRKICVARARIADRLRNLQGSASYRMPGQAATHTWSVRA
jgi:hypothetical protein